VIPENVINSVNDWAKGKDKKEAETIKLLALAFIEEEGIDWYSSSGRAKTISYIEHFYYGELGNDISFNDNWIGHQNQKNPFEISFEEFFRDVSKEEIENNDFKSPEDKDHIILKEKDSTKSDKSNYLNQIESLKYSVEVKELLKELDDKSYKSIILTNLNKQGQLKLIRKAKILFFRKNL